MTRRLSARWMLGAGAGLAVVAGGIQATIGSHISAWTGHKAEPGRLGLLTIALGTVTAAASIGLTWPRASAALRVTAGTIIAISTIVGATTVGRLWFVPGPLLVVGLILAADDWGSVLGREWGRVLLVALGCGEILIALRADPAITAFGLLGAAVLLAVAATSRRSIAGMVLVVVATVPLAVAAWAAVAPPAMALASVIALGALPVEPGREDATR